VKKILFSDITEDDNVYDVGYGVHVTLVWGEIISGYNTPDTVVRHRCRKKAMK